MAAKTPATYDSAPVRIGEGTAHTVVRTGADGKLASIGVVFTPVMLVGLPKATGPGEADFPYVVPMPTNGPRTVIDHVVIDWEAAGHPRLTCTTCRTSTSTSIW